MVVACGGSMRLYVEMEMAVVVVFACGGSCKLLVCFIVCLQGTCLVLV